MNTPKLAELIDSRILELRRQGSITAKEIAKRAGIKETSLSMIRKGNRGVSQDVAIKIAAALQLDPNRFQQVVTAAGYAPVSLDSSLKPIINHLLTQEGFWEITKRFPSETIVWTFGLGIPETIDDSFLAVFRANYARGLRYVFFISQRNALDFAKLRDNLQLDGVEVSLERCNAIILPDESFHHRDGRLFKCLFTAPGGVRRGFAATNEVEGEYLYRELLAGDTDDLEAYLEQLYRRAQKEDGPALPTFVGAWLLQKGYQLRV